MAVLDSESSVTAGELLVKQPNNATASISHDKLKTIDNLVSTMDDLRSVKKNPPDEFYDLGSWVNFSFYTTASVGTLVAGAIQGNIVLALISLGVLIFGIYSASSSKVNNFESSTTILNVIPRLFWRKDFKRKKKEFLELRASYPKMQEEYAKVCEASAEKIKNLLEEVNKELSLGTSYLSYDANENKIELRNQHEYKSEALRQAVFASETSKEKSINMLTK